MARLAQAVAAKPHFSSHSEMHDAPQKVLIVDDYNANILVTSTYLESMGFDYDVAVSGYQAIEMVKQRSYIAILMDIQMPGMDGIQATSLIRQFEEESGRPRQPIIAFTAHPLVGGEDRCLLMDMDSFITKPFNPQRLKDLLVTFKS